MPLARASDNWTYLRSLLTVRDNPYLLLMARREQRARSLLPRLTLWLLLLAAVTLGGLALGRWFESPLRRVSVGLGPGELAAALLITVEFYTVWSATARRRYSLRLAEQENAAEHYRLVPLTWIERAGLRNTYPMLVGLAMMALAVPLHLICAVAGGWDDWWHLIVSHGFMLLPCFIAVDRPPRSSTRRSRLAEEVDTSSIRKRRKAGVAIAVSNLLVQALSHVGRSSLAQSLVLYIILAPYLLPQALSGPRGFYRFHLPIAVPVLLALVPAVVVWVMRMGRLVDDRPATIRIAPWSLAGLGTVYGLVVLIGFCWHWVADGSIAALLASHSGPMPSTAMVAHPVADPSRAAEGLFVALLAAWCVVIAGPHLLRSGAVTWGPLPSHHSLREPLSGRRAWLMEWGWTLEAGLSVYVPLLAFLIACWLGGIPPRVPSPVILWASLVCMTALMGAWVVGRCHRWLHARGWRRGHRLLWVGLVLLVPLGLYAPPPLGPLCLSAMPVIAGLSLVPGLGGLIGPVTGRLILPTPEQAAILQLLLAVVGTLILIRLWRLHPANRSLPAPTRQPRDTAVLFSKGRALERITPNPVALRILRGRNSTENPYTMAIGFGVFSVLCYLVWGACRGMQVTGASTGLIVGMLSDSPWMLGSLPMAMAMVISVFAAGISTSSPLRMERATGALTHTCMTPLRPKQLMAGYLIPSAMGTLGRLTGAGIALPLLFVGTDAGLIARILGLVLAVFGFLYSLIAITGLLSGLPGARAYGREGFWDELAWSLPVMALWLPLAPLIVMAALILGPSGPAALTTVTAGVLLVYLVLLYWGVWSARSRFRLLMTQFVPQGPDTQLLSDLNSDA